MFESLLVAFLTCGAVALGAPIAINNPGFEAVALGEGGFTAALPQWNKGCPPGDGNTGTFNPSTAHYPGGAVPEGLNVAISNGPTISQVLGSSLAANTFYTLQAVIGTRLGGAAPTTHVIQLWAGGTQIAQDAPTIPTVGTFVTASAPYFASVADPLLTQPLEIRLLKTGGPQANFDNVRLDATPALTLQNPTALYSQGGYPIGEAIDNDLTKTSGWAGAVGGASPTPPNIGVFETQVDVGFLSGTLLTVRLDQQYPSHSIGKFRLSVTTDDRSTYADGLANGGDVTANWVTVTPLEAVSAGGATMTIEPDNAIFVSGTYPSLDTYTVKVATPLTGITGVRLELPEDARLSDTTGGGGGPGRTGHGNYVLTDFRVAANKLLQNPTALYSQNGWPVANSIDESLSTGWANAGNNVDNTACYEFAEDIGYEQGVRLTINLDQYYTSSLHNLGRFRLSVTTDDRALFADGLSAGGDVTANWVELVPISAVSAGGATLTIGPDNSILASGAAPFPDTYTITADTWLQSITGIRLEMLEDPSLPANGPGRASNGNFVLSNFNVGVTLLPEPTTLALLGLGGLALLRRRRMRRV